MEHLGTVSTEGGPFLLADALVARTWRGGVTDDYHRLCTALDAKGPSWGLEWRLGSHAAVFWEAEGDGVADVYAAGPASLVLVRGWFDGDWDDATREAIAATAGAKTQAQALGELDVECGVLAILWSPEDGRCIRDKDIARGTGEPTGGLAVDGSSLLVRLPPGRYACGADLVEIPAGQAIRCFVARSG